MTQKEATILVEIITKVVRKELNIFRKQLLTETARPQQRPVEAKSSNKLVEVQKNFRNQFHVNRPQQKALSKDPVLNSILMECAPIPKEDEDPMMNEIIEAGINIPTDASGRPMASAGNANHVLEAMNRDYSGMFKPSKAQGQNSTQAPIEKSRLRSNFLAAMDGSDEEDFSFLDGVS